jgi:hypothetical protein
MQFDRHLVFARIFDRTLENNLVPINVRAEFIFEAIHDVLRRDGSKCLPCLASLQREDEPRLPNSAR